MVSEYEIRNNYNPFIPLITTQIISVLVGRSSQSFSSCISQTRSSAVEVRSFFSLPQLMVFRHLGWCGGAVASLGQPEFSSSCLSPQALLGARRVLLGSAPSARDFQFLSFHYSWSVGKGIKGSPGFHLIGFAVVLVGKRGIKLHLSGNEGIVCCLFMFFHLRCIGLYLMAFPPAHNSLIITRPHMDRMLPFY